MQILALDTASPFPSVTLLLREEVWEETLSQDRRASEELLPAIARCLQASGTSLARCDRIAVCSGPGSFTGLRIGLATAWALSRAANVAVETVSTLEALVETARGPGVDRVAAVLDAGRGDVVLAVYSLEGARARIEEAPERLPIAEALRRVAPFETVALPADLLGSGMVRPVSSVSQALARAVARAPGNVASSLEGIYSRPSAAEEKHGAP